MAVIGKEMRDNNQYLRRTNIFVVFPIDEFTGKPIFQRDFKVEIEGAQKPIVKPEGFYVFTDILALENNKTLAECKLTITLSGHGYQKMTVRVAAACIDSKNPVYTVRVKPDWDYPFPAHTLFMKGMLGENKRLLAAVMDREQGLHLKRDYIANEDTIAVCQGTRKTLAGSIFYLTDLLQEDGAWIQFQSFSNELEGNYKLVRTSLLHWQKNAAWLFPALEQVAGNEPIPYFFAFPYTAGRTDEIYELVCCVAYEDTIKEYKMNLQPQKTLVADFF